MFVSAFDLFRAGIGPSSAHTVAPMRAARRFVHALAADGLFHKTRRVRADLYGPVACVGRDQATDRAILAGLAGREPDTVDPGAIEVHAAHVRANGQLALNGTAPIAFDPATDVVFHVDKAIANQGSAIRFTARGGAGEILATRVYFPVGSGRILAEDEASRATDALRIPFAFTSAEHLVELGQAHGKKIAEMQRTNELAFRSPGEVRDGLLKIAATMRNSVERGLAASDPLPGAGRRAPRASTHAAAITGRDPDLPAWAAVYATAVAEENAGGGRVVSAPSSGAAGPVAALLHQWRTRNALGGDEGSVAFLLAAAAVGNLLLRGDRRPSGCQGEVGVACAMAAAGLVAARGGSNRQLLYAAGRAVEPFVGMACDPVGALVQDPCIERNAAAAAHAVDVARLALRQPDPPAATLDAAVLAMAERGREMAGRFKESSVGGLAVNVAEC
jgi:L-serine dehydratase